MTCSMYNKVATCYNVNKCKIHNKCVSLLCYYTKSVYLCITKVNETFTEAKINNNFK
jgi:hypothetical protein